MPEPKRPDQLSEYAAKTLQALAAEGLGHTISLGGALGLLHYLDYRSTHDVDAWWSPSTTGEERERVLRTIEASLQSAGEIGTRSWGEVVSVELRVGGKKVFSFQIATRSAQLEPPQRLPWTDVSLDPQEVPGEGSPARPNSSANPPGLRSPAWLWWLELRKAVARPWDPGVLTDRGPQIGAPNRCP